ncbi:hypothetical protein Rhopal_007504-T1 [Rhodotorula paludigena]|uniref:Major facilitator superfamily (MFS) profile domain-containing protein n=1 Tax=Rhodotorula paludigena TaxID=86838 RepID=A0AAV5GWT9_9BASI|nr:hypothetical protein Rhopal_007504-T1 [Rhodotorula paludigena]
MPLPLFPRIIEDFVRQEGKLASSTPTLLTRTMAFVRSLRAVLFSSGESRWDLTLLGGILASLFSFCQFLVSPYLGRLSDRFGRRPVLLATMVGNLASALLWLFASRFELYAASRIVGGLAEGNVQLSIACITDVTTPETRARSLALVGAAFSLAFTLGPSLGAYFASRVFGHGSRVAVPSALNALVPALPAELQLNAYAVPAAMTVALLAFETVYLALYLPETRGWSAASASATENGPSASQSPTASASSPAPRSYSQRLDRLRLLSFLHFSFLLSFSGGEFTLCFLTHALFAYSNAQNGRLLGFVGIVSALLQGGWVRRRARKHGGRASKTASLAQAGVCACAASLAGLAALPQLEAAGSRAAATGVLWSAAAGLAFVSATVVNSLNALASLETDSAGARQQQHGEGTIDKGAALGSFRSHGQLGRALGPLVTTAVYWLVSPTAAYALGAVGCVGVAVGLKRIVREEEEREREVKRE